MWELWVIHRARKDGPVLMGWRHPWEGHGHGPGDRGGGGHSGEHVTEQKNERTAFGHRPQDAEKKVTSLKEVTLDEVVAREKNQPQAARVVRSSDRGEGGQEELESKSSSSGKTHRDERKSTRSQDSGVKRPPREKSVSAAKKEQMLQRAIEQHPELLSLLKVHHIRLESLFQIHLELSTSVI
ncbi:hypothetical protein R1sor_009560 [Riccia sorocarpa]|uniref:Uncharacterized protein n=1 Tax=Riccia sorocarpa TaxID=122646 RepID=A0ABD3HXG3_9MARC